MVVGCFFIGRIVGEFMYWFDVGYFDFVVFGVGVFFVVVRYVFFGFNVVGFVIFLGVGVVFWCNCGYFDFDE